MLIQKVFAQEVNEVIESARGLIPKCPSTGCGWKEFMALINNVVGLLFKVVPFIAIFWIIYGGFDMLSSMGDKTKFDKGKQKIITAVWGLVLVYGSYMIYDLIRGVFQG
jgi:ABC-type amino acid transport system permease subunit